jgi:hypothetical protein
MYKTLQLPPPYLTRVIAVARTLFPEPGHLYSQIDFLERCAEANGLIVITTIQLPATSDWEMGQYVSQLIERKKKRDDYEALLVMDAHRLCGKSRTHRFRDALESVGVRVITLMDDTTGWGPLTYFGTGVHQMAAQEVYGD